MIDDWVGHHHGHRDSPVSRLPAGLKLGVALVVIVGTVVVPPRAVGWFVGASLLLLVAMVVSRIPPLFLLKRLAWLSPLILSVALVNALQPAARGSWVVVATKSTICLLTIILVSNTTPFSQILRVLKARESAGLADYDAGAHAPLPVRAGGGSGTYAPRAGQPHLHAGGAAFAGRRCPPS